MNLDKLNQLVGSIKKDLGNEQFSTTLLANKISSTAVANPHDMTLRMMSNVLQKMASDGKPFIERDQLQGLYKQFYSQNTLADSVLSDELGLESKALKNTYASKSYSSTNKSAKSVLSNVYETMLDGDFVPTFFDKSLAVQANQVVGEYLQGQGLSAKTETVSGNPDTILVLASVETPKGITSFFVPVETESGVALAPNQFITHYGSADFKYASAYVVQHSGEQVKVASEVVFNSLLKKTASTISKVDLAVAQKKLNDSRAQNQVNLEAKMASAPAPKHKYSAYVPVDTIAFSKKLATAGGIADLEFGSGIVRQAGELITRTLNSMGYKPLAIEMASTDKNTLNFAVKVATASFFVPVKVEGQKVYNPQVVVSNGAVQSFSKDTMRHLLQNTAGTDSRALTAIASSSNISTNDLMKEFKTSLASNNIDRAEEVLGYLQVKSPSSYKEAMAMFMDTLSGTAKVADACSSYFMGKNSAYPICNHTGLPMNKVAQDSHGKCYALTSKK